MFKNLLVPTDGSELSKQTVTRAVTFAKEINARITFFYAKPDYPVSFYGEGSLFDASTPEKFAELADIQAQEITELAVTEARTAGVECCTTVTTSDTPYQAIIDAANDNKCDLIFMASHGRRGISGLLLGSETHKVLTHTSIPVLVYR